MTEPPAPPLTLAAHSWGELAAERLHLAWLGRVWEVTADSLLLVGSKGEAVRLVTARHGDGPFHVVVPEAAPLAWGGLERGSYTWRVADDLWLGDELTLQLPTAEPWVGRLRWREEDAVPSDSLVRHLALLADWLQARAPESSLASLLPDLLAYPESLIERAGARADLPGAVRLFRWRAARVLAKLLPALAVGDMAEAEQASHHLAGLGPGAPPAGDCFLLGLIAGLALWPDFLTEGCGLRPTPLLQRLVRGTSERTTLLGRATLQAAMAGRWDARWHALHGALLATGPHPDEQRDHLLTLAGAWLEEEPPCAGAALAGLVLPFLWYQRFFAR